MVTVGVKQRGGSPIVNVTQPGPVLHGDSAIDYHASFNGNGGIWGCGPDVETAAGDCLKTASSLSELSGFTLSESLRELSDRELGEMAWSGSIPDIETLRVD